MDILWRGIVGGLMTGLIAWLARRGSTLPGSTLTSSVLPGILPLFPTFGLIALYLVGERGDAAGFRGACLAGLKTLPAYAAFLLVCYWAARRTDYRLALLLGLAAWLAVALAIFLGPRWIAQD
jgi:membrane protein GlpM